MLVGIYFILLWIVVIDFLNWKSCLLVYEKMKPIQLVLDKNSKLLNRVDLF